MNLSIKIVKIPFSSSFFAKNSLWKRGMGCFLMLFSFFFVSVSAQTDRPKLVVGLVVDQMRWDYLHYYKEEYGQGGLRRLLSEGYSFDNTMINYLPAVTAIGHSSAYTGSVPALTGIAGNNWYEEGKKVYCCDDATVQSVGSRSEEGQMSPRRMLASTIGDQLRLAESFQNKVIGVALKDRGAILPAGHSATAAYWWDGSAGCFVSSTYYMDALPRWAEEWNKEHRQPAGTDVKTSDLGVALTFSMAEAVLKNEALGKGQHTDMLCVSVSSTDAVGHRYGTRGKENKSVYLELDKRVEEFLHTLDAEVGKGNYLLFLTADHGAVHNPNYLKDHKLPAGGMEPWAKKNELNAFLAERFGIEKKAVLDMASGQVWLNEQYLKAQGLSLAEVENAVVEKLLEDKRIAYAVRRAEMAQSYVPEPIKSRMINGYFRGRSGEVVYVARPNYGDNSDQAGFKGTNHGQWNPYDTHIPFVLMGWGVQHGHSNTPATITDIAPTVCALLHIQMPNACVGNAQDMK